MNEKRLEALKIFTRQRINIRRLEGVCAAEGGKPRVLWGHRAEDTAYECLTCRCCGLTRKALGQLLLTRRLDGRS